MSDIFLIQTAVNSPKTAKAIAKQLVKEKYAACGQVIPRVTSFYWFEGKLESGREYLVTLKTHRDKLDRAIEEIKAQHPYQIPEIIVFEIDKVDEKYQEWLLQSLDIK